jgi:hypothetical protein
MVTTGLLTIGEKWNTTGTTGNSPGETYNMLMELPLETQKTY